VLPNQVVLDVGHQLPLTTALLLCST
jgi:hypothetical protein